MIPHNIIGIANKAHTRGILSLLNKYPKTAGATIHPAAPTATVMPTTVPAERGFKTAVRFIINGHIPAKLNPSNAKNIKLAIHEERKYCTIKSKAAENDNSEIIVLGDIFSGMNAHKIRPKIIKDQNVASAYIAHLSGAW